MEPVLLAKEGTTLRWWEKNKCLGPQDAGSYHGYGQTAGWMRAHTHTHTHIYIYIYINYDE